MNYIKNLRMLMAASFLVFAGICRACYFEIPVFECSSMDNSTPAIDKDCVPPWDFPSYGCSSETSQLCIDVGCCLFVVHPFINHIVCPSGEIPKKALSNVSLENTVNVCGSIIQIEDQVLIERIHLRGVPFELVYSSDKVPGKKTWNKANIPITSNNYQISTEVIGQNLSINVAGQSINQDWGYITPSHSYDFRWDGKDASGSLVSGTVMAEIEVSERYVPSLAVQSMPNPLPGSRVITPLFNGTQQEGGVYRLKYVQKSWIPLGNIFNNVKSANGWRPSIWHEFDIARSKVFLGDGTVMNSKAFVRPNNERIVPNSQRNEVYVFDSALRHVKTLNLTTGKLKFRFEYTSLDKISKIIDNYNNETLFNYSGSNLTSIVSPYGHVTNFSVDVSGYLSSASLSNNENYTMIYNAEGLLTSFTKPSGNLSVMTYDSDGNLISDVNDSGYSSTLSSSFLSGVRTISQISAEGRVRTVNFDNSDFNTKTLTEPSGLTMSTVWDNSQLESTTYGPNSYTEHHKKTIFERFGEGFYRLSEVIRNGSQLPSKSTLESAELIDPLDPLSVSNLTTTVTEGDSITISHYNSSTKTMTATSSLGLETTIIHNNQGDPISVKLGPYLPFTLTYDSHGRITSSGQGSSRQTHYTYGSNGLIATSTDPLNRTTSYNYNSEDRISTVLLPDLRSIQFSYDDGGNVISVMPANNKIHHFTYDSSELMSSYLPPALSAGDSP